MKVAMSPFHSVSVIARPVRGLIGALWLPLPSETRNSMFTSSTKMPL